MKDKRHRIDFTDIKVSEVEKDQLMKIFNSLPLPKSGELNFLKLAITKAVRGDLILKVLLRNGTDSELELKQISIRILNQNKETVAQGTFQLENLIVSAQTSKPATFEFPKKSVLLTDVDLSSCTIHVISDLRN